MHTGRHSLEEHSLDITARLQIYQAVDPIQDYYHPEKSEALHGIEVALSLEKMNFDKLTELYQAGSACPLPHPPMPGRSSITPTSQAAEEERDTELQDFLDKYIREQAEDVKRLSVWVSQLRRIGGSGTGLWLFDRALSEGNDPAEGA